MFFVGVLMPWQALIIITGYTIWAAKKPFYEPAALQLWPLPCRGPELIGYTTWAAKQPFYEPAALQLWPLPCRGLD